MDPSLSRYRFGNFELQPNERRLLKGGAPVTLGPRAFDVLVALVERGGHLVTREQLLQRVWPGVVVEENTVQAQVSALRKVLGRAAIATVSRHGYRFALELGRGQDAAAREAGVAHNLPQPLTSLIGREENVAHLVQLLGTTRLLTLTGAGGCGKTRLAIEVAGRALERYADGVWFVELASLTDPGLVAQTANTVLGVKVASGESETQCLISHLASKQVLLVLDNAEHLLGACAQLADGLLRGCRGLSILVTSREALGINGEQIYRVPSLATPDTQQEITPEKLSACDSARLFIERARLWRPNFAVTRENAPALASVCRQLDGIPLAIELAAARVRSMSVEEVDSRLIQRFSLLTGGSRAALPRHRTLRSLIDWSYDLLDEAEQAMLRRVSVFSGGWTLGAAEGVCLEEGDERARMLDLLVALGDKNLITTHEREGATRYGILETIRRYAGDRLGEVDDEARWRSRHLRYFLALTQNTLEVRGVPLEVRLRQVETELDNLRAAMAWACVHREHVADGLKLGADLWEFWILRGYSREGYDWLRRLIAATPVGEARLLRASALSRAGILAHRQGDAVTAKALFVEGLALARELDDRSRIADFLNLLGIVAETDADYPAARRFYREALAILRDVGNQRVVAVVLANLATVIYREGDLAGARSLLEESIGILRGVDSLPPLANALNSLAGVVYEQGDLASARTLFAESLTIYRALDYRVGVAQVLEEYARVVSALGESITAARLWGAQERLRGDTGEPMAPNERPNHERCVVAARAALGDDAAFDRAWQDGRKMTLDESVQFALDSLRNTTNTT